MFHKSNLRSSFTRLKVIRQIKYKDKDKNILQRFTCISFLFKPFCRFLNIYLFNSIHHGRNCHNNCWKRQLDSRSVTNDGVKYRMWGNMFITNQMQISFLSCFHLKVFQTTVRMSFRDADVRLLREIMFRGILILNI